MNYIKSIDLPDVQSRLSPQNFKLTRVGVTGVKKLVHIKRPDKDSIIPLVVTMDLFVDLPASQKGSHMSRNLELVSEIIDLNLQKPVSELESFCAKTAKLLLEKHEYATFSEVKAEADYFLDVIYPDGKKGSEPYKIVAEARAKGTGEIKKGVSLGSNEDFFKYIATHETGHLVKGAESTLYTNRTQFLGRGVSASITSLIHPHLSHITLFFITLSP